MSNRSDCETEQSCSERFPRKGMKQVLRDERTAARTEPDDLLRMENHESESYNVGELPPTINYSAARVPFLCLDSFCGLSSAD
ncbi:MAG TPA: hypothetical protein VFW05_14490 [Verrucomicrobiae bacterium]|nr:hypothetical protein [Verrucomicrobiae bacterium]